MIALIAAAVLSLPTIDPAPGCARAAGATTATRGFRLCVAEEWQDRALAYQVWEVTPRSVKVRCISAAQRPEPRAYGRLATCLIHFLPLIQTEGADQ